MNRVRAGDMRAFEALYVRHRPQVHQLALRITRSPGLAEEATQDAFLSLWRGASRYDSERAALRTWLQAMVRNRSIDCLRREGRHETNVHIDEVPPGSLQARERTDEQVMRLEEATRTRRLVQALPASQRTVIELTYFKGLTQTEIASEVGIPLGTVKGRQRLGLAKLQRGFIGQVASVPSDERRVVPLAACA